MKLVKAQEPGVLGKVRELYRKAFPENERKPFSLMETMQKAGAVEILAAVDEEEFQGLAITVSYENLVLLDYFAITENARGGGVGTRALALLKKRYRDKKFFLEIEDSGEEADNQEQRIRRKNFYLRNGMRAMPFLAEVAGVQMEVLTGGCALDFDEYKRVYAGYGPEVERTIKPVQRAPKS